MHIICAIQESVFKFQMKDLLFFSHDSFSPSSSLSYADVWACTQICYLFLFYELFPNTSLLLPMKSPYKENGTCFHRSQESLLSWSGKVLLKQDFIHKSWRYLGSRHISGDPCSKWGCQGWTNIFIPWRICLSAWEHGGISFQMDANKHRAWKCFV